jgi:hypothetical protein
VPPALSAGGTFLRGVYLALMDQIDCGTAGCDLPARWNGKFGMGDSLSTLEEKFKIYVCESGHTTTVHSESGVPFN